MSKNVEISAPLGSDIINAKAYILSAGEYLILEKNHIAYDKKLTFSCRISSFKDEDMIRIGHGEKKYCSSYLEVTRDKISFFEYFDKITPRAVLEHGLEIKDFLTVTIDYGIGITRVTVATASGVYTSGVA